MSSRPARTLLGLTAALLFSMPALAGDKDKDGVPNKFDACKFDAETINGYNDEDGCPDALAKLIVKVVDARGQPVPIVDVTVSDGGGDAAAGGRKDAVAKTNSDGIARIKGLAPGLRPSLELVHGKLGTFLGTAQPLDEGRNQVLVIVGHSATDARAVSE